MPEYHAWQERKQELANLILDASPAFGCELTDWVDRAGEALSELVERFADEDDEAAVHVAFSGTEAAHVLRRMHRDLCGRKRLTDFVQSLEQITDEQRRTLASMMDCMGLRVSSDEPRKVKNAAVFLLWMSHFRPVYYVGSVENEQDERLAKHLNASFALWLVQLWMTQYGEFILEKLPDTAVRVERLAHDLSFRALSQSSLELAMSSLFRPIV